VHHREADFWYNSCRGHEQRLVAAMAEEFNPASRRKRGPEYSLTYDLADVRLTQFSLMELQDLCADRSLPHTGTTAKLRANLEQFRQDLRKMRKKQ
jgi:hypothetical protein